MTEWDAHTDNLKRGLDQAIALDDTIRTTAEGVSPDTLIIFAADHSFDVRLRDGKKGNRSCRTVVRVATRIRAGAMFV